MLMVVIMVLGIGNFASDTRHKARHCVMLRVARRVYES